MNPTIHLNSLCWHKHCATRGMYHPLRRAFVLVFLLVATCSSSAAAKTFQLDKIALEIPKGTQKAIQEFSASVSYDVEKTYAGNHNLIVTVTLSTRGTTNLELL